MHPVAWTVMGLLFTVVVAFRLATRRGRRQIWWVCATVGPATGIASGLLIGNTAAIDIEKTGPAIVTALNTRKLVSATIDASDDISAEGLDAAEAADRCKRAVLASG